MGILKYKIMRTVDEVVLFGYSELSKTIKLIGPFNTENHINYLIEGLCDNKSQIKNMCYALLGFIGDIVDDDLRLNSALDSGLGEGRKLKQEIKNLLNNSWLRPKDENLSEYQIVSNRNPLILELIAHIVIKLQKDNPLFSFSNYIPVKIRPPHIKANEGGLDVIALVQKQNEYFPYIGEVKAYQNDPGGGLIDACIKFSEVSKGMHNSEIRRCLKSFKFVSNKELSDKIWENRSVFSAIVGTDSEYQKDGTFCSRSKEVSSVKCNTLFFISHNFIQMSDLFEEIIGTLYKSIDELED